MAYLELNKQSSIKNDVGGSVNICIFLFHNYIEYFPGDGLIVKECKRCGTVKKVVITSVSQAVAYFGNYDKAIEFCKRNPSVYKSI